MKKNRDTKKNLTKIFCVNFTLRLLVLIVVIMMDQTMEVGFVGSSTYYDDVRYEAGGEYYAQNAQSIIDVKTFADAYASVGDWVGYKLSTPFSSTPLWYWIVCIVMYVTKTKWTIRLLNIIISSFAVIYIYKFTDLIYGNRTALKASYLLALLPYPVIFSCFAYKDHLVMLCTFYLLYKAAKYRSLNRIGIKELLGILLCTLILSLLRSGLTALLIMLCASIAFLKKSMLVKRCNNISIIFFTVTSILVIICFIKYYDTIIYKLQYYLTRHAETLSDTSIAILTINRMTDFYKLPFTYIFSIIMPIGLTSNVTSWYDIVSNLNICMTPIAVGCAYYLVKGRKPDHFIFWTCFLFYTISIITSLNIFRHYYSLLPLSIISFADFYTRASKYEKAFLLLGALLFSFALITYYCFING